MRQRFSKNPLLLLLLGCLSLCLGVSPAEAMRFVVSQIGYHPDAPKIAILEDVPEGTSIKVALHDPNWSDRLGLFKGKDLYKIKTFESFRPQHQAGPGNRNLIVDFSEFKEPGQYELRVEGTEVKSEPIKITQYLYWDLVKPVMKTFYFQRSGQEVEDYISNFYHPASHVDDALLPGTEQYRDAAGGWYTDGGYDKHVIATSFATARMQSLYEWVPKAFQYFKLDYPYQEQWVGLVPDYLHEVKAGLNWLRAMQREDGGVYQKVYSQGAVDRIMPNKDTRPRYLGEVTTQDTAATAATLAMTSRSFRVKDMGYMIKALRTAEDSWNFLAKRPITESDLPYRLWAASELYIATGKDKYHQFFLTHYKNTPLALSPYGNPGILALLDYTLYAPNPDEDARRSIRQKITQFADRLTTRIQKDPYGAGFTQYTWNSNGQLTEQAALLLSAFQLTNEAKYRDAATKTVYYLFGLNPLAKTYVTGVGSNPVTSPHHQMMVVSGKILPGYLVSGPNQFSTEPDVPQGAGPRSYVDTYKAPSVNEPNIVNNASLLFVLGMLNAAYNISQADR